MVDRRQLLKTAIFGGLAPRLDITGAAAQSIPDREAREIIDALQRISRALDTAQSFTEIAEVRRRQVAFLQAEARFPDFIDVGIDVWLGVHDWHVKHGLPVALGRENNRHTIKLLATTLVLRPDMVPNLIGTPY